MNPINQKPLELNNYPQIPNKDVDLGIMGVLPHEIVKEIFSLLTKNYHREAFDDGLVIGNNLDVINFFDDSKNLYNLSRTCRTFAVLSLDPLRKARAYYDRLKINQRNPIGELNKTPWFYNEPLMPKLFIPPPMDEDFWKKYGLSEKFNEWFPKFKPSRRDLLSPDPLPALDFKLIDRNKIKIDFPPLKLTSLIEQTSKIKIAITRPIKEFISHIKNRKRPSIELIARLIKTLALSIFRWHLCDHVFLLSDNCLFERKDIITHSLAGKLSRIDSKAFEIERPYMLENAFLLEPTAPRKKSSPFNYQIISVDTIRKYFLECFQIGITNKIKGNTINDLFRSKYFRLI